MTQTPNGGYSITPLTAGNNVTPNDFSPENYNNTLSFLFNKRVSIDWVSYTFDDLSYNYKEIHDTPYLSDVLHSHSKNYSLIDGLFRSFLSPKRWDEYALVRSGINGYKFKIVIGENIEILFLGPRSARDRSTTQILLRGSACTEFRRSGGTFYNLLSYINTNFTGHFRRFDLPVDDFTGKEIDIYDLLPFAEKHHWTGAFRSLSVIRAIKFDPRPLSEGFQMSFGKTGSNQLVIYDKKLERKEMNDEIIDTPVWYRYEMRFVDDKADEVVRQYLLTYNDDSKFNEFVFSLLKNTITFRVCVNDDYRHRDDWPVLPAWENFLGTVHRVDLKSHSKVPSTLLKKKEWSDKNLARLFAQYLCTLGDDYVMEHLFNIGSAIERLEEHHKEAVNNARKEMGKPEMSDSDFTDLCDRFKKLKSIVDDDVEPLPF